MIRHRFDDIGLRHSPQNTSSSLAGQIMSQPDVHLLDCLCLFHFALFLTFTLASRRAPVSE